MIFKVGGEKDTDDFMKPFIKFDEELVKGFDDIDNI